MDKELDMKKILLLLPMVLIAFWSCEEESEPDTTALENNNIIELEFVIVKNMISGVPSSFAEDSHATDDTCDVVVDCAGECDGDAIEQTYYYDNDGDGLGGDYDAVICSALAPDNWVLNSDDDDDTIESCWIFFTLNLLEEDLETTNGNISFTYDEEDFSIDVSSCIEIGIHKTTRILQDIELEILYLFEDSGFGNVYSYSSPNELLFVK
ncbi:uncharacterized protein METZ01_LOCUS483517 [marine metagenome]|uniref:Uncharacterized protein n=1 Tax=marine metagenome TaxID=408172 RepID=A0A383CF18_9ZZZZ